MSHSKPSDIEFATRLWHLLRKEVKSKKMRRTKVDDNSVSYLDTNEVTDRIPLSYAQISDSLPEDLSVGAMKLIMRIVRELVYGNYLWYFDHENQKNLKAAIAELRIKQILLKTNKPTMHIVNPLFISKGEAIAIAHHSMSCITEHNGACVEAIIPIKEFTVSKPSTIVDRWETKKEGSLLS